MFDVGRSYDCILNGQPRRFWVMKVKRWKERGDHDYLIRWDDGDEEWAYEADMLRWISG